MKKALFKIQKGENASGAVNSGKKEKKIRKKDIPLKKEKIEKENKEKGIDK